MSTLPVSENELKAAISSVFGEIPADDLQERVNALCMGGACEYEGRDVVSVADREWLERMYPEYMRWLHRLKALESNQQQRIAAFLDHCRDVANGIPELFDELSHARMDRTWTAVTEYFESVMPDELLTANRTDFFIDVRSLTAWWTADSDERGIDLPMAIGDCLARGGEFSAEAVEELRPVLVDALSDGTAPLPGFEFQQAQDDVALWEWLSTDDEDAMSEPAWIESESMMEDEGLVLYDVPQAACLLSMVGCRTLPAGAAAHIPALVSRISEIEFPRGVAVQEVVLKEIGTPLSIIACEASRTGNVVQFRRAIGAIAELTSELERRATAAVTAE